ncbi:MAG: 30S ribosomal protein S4, partial [Chloroflexi bacterium]|nr:30S ribosomal protein S4 [Chloroflexota bacterium]
QLREKQKVKLMYGVLERQFRRYFELASRRTGQTGVLLLQTLERRLDNVVYRLGFAKTRPQARQLVTHGHLKVNDRPVNIPSYQVRPGEVIALGAKALVIPDVQDLVKRGPERLPSWLLRDGPSGRVIGLPGREDIGAEIQENLIVELYRR